MERCSVEHAVDEARGDEEAVVRCRSRQRSYPPRMRRTSRKPGASCAARMTPRNGAGTTDCQRGRIAHTTSATRPIAPIAPSGPPSVVPCGLLDSRMCGASRISPVIATRRCQIAAQSIPSNHSSTHGSVLMRTRAIESSRPIPHPELAGVAAARFSRGSGDEPQEAPGRRGRTITAGPTSRPTNLICTRLRTAV